MGTDKQANEQSNETDERVPLATLRVTGTALEESLERIVSASMPGKVAVAAFSSSI